MRGLRRKWRDGRDWRAYKKNRWIPPPDIVKFEAIARHGRRFAIGILVETGTYMGDMSWRSRKLFRHIYTIELGHDLAVKARARLSKHDHIEVLEGDSSLVLLDILQRIEERCLFWLDGHYSSGVTARGPKLTPLAEELSALRKHHISDHIVLIDDARLLGEIEDYPSLEEVRSMLLSINPNYTISVEDDIVQCVPPV